MRYQDQDDNTSALREFVPRARGKDIWKVIMGFGLALAIMLFLNLMPGSVGGATEASLIPLIAVSALCFYIVYLKQQNLDLVMTTEFQNMLFSQAASLGFDFCMFVKRDGSIVYASDGLRALFPGVRQGESQALEGLFATANISEKDQEKVTSAIYANEKERLIFSLTREDGKTSEYILVLEPLVRPSGYMVLRGRAYVAKQPDTQKSDA